MTNAAQLIVGTWLLVQPLPDRVIYCNNLTVTPAHLRGACEPTFRWINGPGNCTVCSRHKRYPDQEGP